MSNETAVTVREESAIAAYFSDDDVTSIADRLMALHPEAKKVGPAAMRAVANLALMRGANPLPTAGEIYVWPDNRGNVLMDMGIAYYRRIASKKDTVLWTIEPRLMNEQEREKHRIKKGDIGAICQGSLLSKIRELVQMGVPFKDAQAATKRTATAIVEHSDQFYTRNSQYNKAGDPRSAPHGRTWEWVAEKRSEKAFYKMMSLVDDSLTERIDTANQVVGKVDVAYQLHEERQDYTTDDANHEFFGDPLPAGTDEGPEWDGLEAHDVVDGDFEDFPWEDEPAGAEPEVIVSELHFGNATFAEFLQYCVDTIDRYDHPSAVKGALGKLGFASWPGTKNPNYAAEREAMYTHVKQYASFRAAGMSSEDAMAAIVDDLFGVSEEE